MHKERIGISASKYTRSKYVTGEVTMAITTSPLCATTTRSTWTYVDNKGSTGYFFTNDGSPFGRLVSIDLNDPKVQGDVIPQSEATSWVRAVKHWIGDRRTRSMNGIIAAVFFAVLFASAIGF